MTGNDVCNEKAGLLIDIVPVMEGQRYLQGKNLYRLQKLFLFLRRSGLRKVFRTSRFDCTTASAVDHIPQNRRNL